MKKIKPIAERFSQWNNADEVIYRCPKCNCSFSVFGINEKFCHNCGQEIDWNVIVRVNKQWADAYHCSDTYEQRKEIVKKIDKFNQERNFEYAVEMTDSFEMKPY